MSVWLPVEKRRVKRDDDKGRGFRRRRADATQIDDVRPDLASTTQRRASLLLLLWHYIEHVEGTTQGRSTWLCELASRLLHEVDGC